MKSKITKVLSYSRDRVTGEVLNYNVRDVANTVTTATGGNTGFYLIEIANEICY